MSASSLTDKITGRTKQLIGNASQRRHGRRDTARGNITHKVSGAAHAVSHRAHQLIDGRRR